MATTRPEHHATAEGWFACPVCVVVALLHLWGWPEFEQVVV